MLFLGAKAAPSKLKLNYLISLAIVVLRLRHLLGLFCCTIKIKESAGETPEVAFG